MRDYYSILGLSEGASQADIKRTFRKLAMKYHPDRNPGNEKWAEGKFKQVNEAYAVLSDEGGRREYDRMKQAGFAGTGTRYASGRYYSQEQVFQDAFTNPYLFQELMRMFQGAGLRFDEKFADNMFFGGKGFGFAFSGQPAWGVGQRPAAEYKPPLFLRLIGKAMKFALKKMLSVESIPRQGADLYREVVLSQKEAATGTEKAIKYNRGKEKKRLVVKVPAGVTEATRIRLKRMGLSGIIPGDLYVTIRIRS